MATATRKAAPKATGRPKAGPTADFKVSVHVPKLRRGDKQAEIIVSFEPRHGIAPIANNTPVIFQVNDEPVSGDFQVIDGSVRCYWPIPQGVEKIKVVVKVPSDTRVPVHTETNIPLFADVLAQPGEVRLIREHTDYGPNDRDGYYLAFANHKKEHVEGPLLLRVKIPVLIEIFEIRWNEALGDEGDYEVVVARTLELGDKGQPAFTILNIGIMGTIIDIWTLRPGKQTIEVIPTRCSDAKDELVVYGPALGSIKTTPSSPAIVRLCDGCGDTTTKYRTDQSRAWRLLLLRVPYAWLIVTVFLVGLIWPVWLEWPLAISMTVLLPALLIAAIGFGKGIEELNELFKATIKTNNRWALCMVLMTAVSWFVYFRADSGRPPAVQRSEYIAQQQAARQELEREKYENAMNPNIGEAITNSEAKRRGLIKEEKPIEVQSAKVTAETKRVRDLQHKNVLRRRINWFLTFATFIYLLLSRRDEVRVRYSYFWAGLKEKTEGSNLTQVLGAAAGAAASGGTDTIMRKAADHLLIDRMFNALGRGIRALIQKVR
jgi:hypothetical protein